MLSTPYDEHHHLFFVRHGERADRAPQLKMEYPEKQDPPLTPLGVQQAEETGRFFKEYMEKHPYLDRVKLETSPFMRTMQTAAGIARVLGTPKLELNYTYCEWMSSKLFDEEQLHSLILSKAKRGDR